MANAKQAKELFNLNSFKSQLFRTRTDGLYKPNLYMVEFIDIKLPDPTTGGGGFWTTQDPHWSHFIKDRPVFWANSANLPGVQIITSDHRRQGYGPFDRRAFGAMMTDIPITFMVDNGGEILAFFNNWMNNVINYNLSGGEHKLQTAAGASAGLFEIRYPEAYKCGIKISTLDQTSKYIISYTLHEAFPMQMGDISIAWAETDQFTSLPVQFTFRTYNTDKQPIPHLEIGPKPKAVEDLPDYGLKAAHWEHIGQHLVPR